MKESGFVLRVKKDNNICTMSYYFDSKEDAIDYIKQENLEYNPDIQIEGLYYYEKVC